MTTPARPDLLKRVTSAGKAPPPPAARPQPQPAAPVLTRPLPVGQLISARDPAGLTPFEREQLAAAGVDATEPIPGNMAEILEQVRQEATAFLPPPVDPNRPPLQVRTVQEHEMTPAQKAEVRSKIEAALAAEADARARAAEAAAEERLQPGVRAGLLQARIARAQAEAKAATPPAGAVPVVADLPVRAGGPRQGATTPDGRTVPKSVSGTAPAVSKPVSTPTPPPPPPPAEDLGVTAALTHCPHCAHDLSMDDIPEPDPSDRIAFLHCMLGDKPYEKEYDLFGGHVRVVFRTLTTQERDAVQAQVAAEYRAGEFTQAAEYVERVSRYELYLSVRKVTSDSPGLLWDMPAGFTPATNPHAESHWTLPAPAGPGDTGLKAVAEFMLADVLKTASLCSVVTVAAHRFRRLVSKMEAMADNRDFWQPTGGRS